VSVDPLWVIPGKPLADDDADGEADEGALDVAAFVVVGAVGVLIGRVATGLLSV
jgi:hypothetical protein